MNNALTIYVLGISFHLYRNSNERHRRITEVLHRRTRHDRRGTSSEDDTDQRQCDYTQEPKLRASSRTNHYEEDSPFNSPYVNGEELDHIASNVQDLEATVRELKRRGVTVVVEPYAIGGWKEAYIKDPNGIWIELLQRK